MDWKAFYTHPNFRNATPEDQEAMRVGYFWEEIAPKLKTPEDIKAAAIGFDLEWNETDPTEYAPDRYFGEGVVDFGKGMVGLGAKTASGIVDAVAPDVVPRHAAQAELEKGGIEGFLSQQRLMSDWDQAKSGRAISGGMAGLARFTEPLLGDLSRHVAGRFEGKHAQHQARLMEIEAAENEARAAKGLPSMGEAQDATLGAMLSGSLSAIGDKVMESRSRHIQAVEQKFGKASQEGVFPLLGEIADSPLQFAEMVGPSLATFAGGAGLAGRGSASMARRSRVADEGVDTAGRMGAAGAITGMSTGMGAEDAKQYILRMPDELIEQLPMFQDLTQSMSPEDARRVMAETAFDTAVATGTPINALTSFVPAALRMNVLEDFIAGTLKGSTTRSVLAQTGLGAVKEFPAEFAQGVGQELAARVGQYAGGALPAEELNDDLLALGVMEGIAAMGPGAVAGAITGMRARDGATIDTNIVPVPEVLGTRDADMLIGEVMTDNGAVDAMVDAVAEPETVEATDTRVTETAPEAVETTEPAPFTAESWDDMPVKAREEAAARTGMLTPSGRPNAAARRLARKPFAELTAEEQASLAPVTSERRADTDTRARIESLPETEQQTEIQRLRAQVEEQQRQLDTDPLTTVRSVRAFNRDIMDGVQATRVYRTGGDEFGFVTADGSVGAIDLDVFKVVNDTIGQSAGDSVLRTVGEILNKYEGDTRSAPEIAQAVQQELEAKKVTLDKFDENGNFVQKYAYDGIAASVGTADPSVGANESDPAVIAKARRAAADAAVKVNKQQRIDQGIIEERGSKTSRRIRPIGPPAVEEGRVLQDQLPGVADVQPVPEVQGAEAQASDVVDVGTATERTRPAPAEPGQETRAEPSRDVPPERTEASTEPRTEPETEAVGAEGEGTPDVGRPIQRRPAREERKDESPEAKARREKRIQDAIDKLKKNPKFARRLNALNRALKASDNREVTPAETPAELKPLVDRIAKLFGVDTFFVRSDDWNGVNVSPDAIFISETSTDPFVQVMGHELVHAMRRQAPELYQSLVEAIRPLMKDKAFASRLAAVRRRARAASEVAGDKITEEVMADVVGEIVLSDPSLLAGIKPNLIQRVLNFIKKWFDTLLKGKSDETYHDVYAAREAVAAILDSWADRTDAENRARVADMGPMFSRPQDATTMQAVISKKAIQAGLNPRAFPKVKFVPSRDKMPSNKPGPFLSEGVVYIPSDITPEAAYAGLLRESVKIVGYRNLFNDTRGIDALLHRSLQNPDVLSKAQELANKEGDWTTMDNIKRLSFVERAIQTLPQDNSMRLRMLFRLRKALGVSTDLAGSIVRDAYTQNTEAVDLKPSQTPQAQFEDMVAALPDRSIGEAVRTIFEGAAEKLLRGRGTKALGQAIKKYVDLKQAYDGMISSIMRKPMKGIADSKRFGRMLRRPWTIYKEMTGQSPVEVEFEAWAKAWNQSEAEGQAEYDKMSAEGKAMADAWKAVADMTGKEMVKHGVEVAETYIDDSGHVKVRYRPMRQVKRFIPRMLHDRFNKALQDPVGNPEAWSEMVDILIRNGVVLNEQAAWEMVQKRKATKRRAAVVGDFMANMELARSEGWPTEMYDQSLRASMNYLTRWSDRMAQIRSFGQKHRSELFDETLSKVASSDARTRDYLSLLQKIIYRDRSLQEGAWIKFFGKLNQLATGLLLGNPGTAVLNLIGGSTLNNMAYGRDAIRAYFDLVTEFRKTNEEMHELGMVSQDFLSLIHDYDSDPSSWLSTFVTKSMKYGGYTPTERIIRAHAYLSSKHKLRRALKAWSKGFGSKEARTEAAWAVRNGFNPFDLMRDARTNKDLRGEHIDGYLRMAVNLTQGSYKLDQVPLFTDTPVGRIMFKFQKFGTQLSRMFHKNYLQPFMQSLLQGGEKIAFTDTNGQKVSFRARNFHAMLTYFGMAIPGGLATLYARAAAFGFDLPVPDWEEIEKALEDKDTAKAFGMAMDMTFESLIAMGGIGILQTPAVMMKDFSEQRRVPQPTNPPAMNAVNQVQTLYWKFLEQGYLTKADLGTFVEQTFSGYRAYQRGAMSIGMLMDSEAESVRAERNRRNIREIQRLTRRYASEMEIGETRRRGKDFGYSPQTPINRAIMEQLYLDNPGQAQAIFRDWIEELAKEHVGTKDGEARIAAARTSLQSYLRVRQPTIVNSKPDDATRRAFLRWAKENLTERQWNLIHSMDETYRNNANIAFGFFKENDRRMRTQEEKRERVLTRKRVDELQKQWGITP